MTSPRTLPAFTQPVYAAARTMSVDAAGVAPPPKLAWRRRPRPAHATAAANLPMKRTSAVVECSVRASATSLTPLSFASDAAARMVLLPEAALLSAVQAVQVGLAPIR